MSRLREEIRIIPTGGLLVSLVIAGALAFLILVISSEDEDMPLVARLLIATLLPAIVLIYFLLVAYVHGDSKRRGMRPVMWTLVALFVPNAIGIIAYFIVREPILHPCPSCGTAARKEFAFCPSCGINLPRACPSCHGPVEPVWTHCAHCGGTLAAGELENQRLAVPPDGSAVDEDLEEGG